MEAQKMPNGALRPWNVADLPAPPKFNFRNAMAVIGPGTIALSMSIGSGEWLIGPSAAVRFGTSVMWIVIISVFFQVFLNQEFARYTLYTGEPVLTGFMRTKPGPKLWGWLYPLFGMLQVAWPGWAAAAAGCLFAALYGHLPDAAVAGDRSTMLVLGYILFFACLVIVLFGGRIERILEWLAWGMVTWIVVYLLIVDVFFVPAKAWTDVAGGFFKFGSIPRGPTGVDWPLMGAFAAYAGAGGIGNCWITNWLRDKGFGMGKVIGFIPSAVAGKEVKLAHVGTVFEPTEKNMSTWTQWWKYLWVDQGILFGGGCVIGMYLCVLLAYGVIPHGTDIAGLATGAYQADYLMKRVGRIMWFLTLLNGFWVLFGTQLNNMEGLTRVITDHIWTGSERARRVGDVRYVYYTVLAIFVIWGCIAINMAKPFVLIILGANMAGFIFVFSGVHILVTQHRFLPKEVRAPMWRQVIIALSCIFFAFFVLMNIVKLIGG
ncbi:MAG: Nramp family divalent metal transporter [Deltaproteobacteria bacterium]|nr:MAG: Nramp family divalent metal transporter [Deltaproteobacteria bacterium]